MSGLDPDARFADHWDASWALATAGSSGVLARVRFALDARPHAARAWVAATGLFRAHPLGFHAAADDPPHAVLVVNAETIDLPRNLLVRGQAVALDLAAHLREGTNDLSVQAEYPTPPTMLGMQLPVRVGVLLQCDLEIPGRPLIRIATGDRDLLPRVMPARPALDAFVWQVLTRRAPGGRFETAGGSFLHPLIASPLLRLPRRGGRIEAEADADVPRFRHERRAPVPRDTLAPGAARLVDFGEELVGHLEVDAQGPIDLMLSPGESEAEAADMTNRLDNAIRRVQVDERGLWRDPRRSALRWVIVRNDGREPADIQVSLDACEIDLAVRGSFRCADPLLERIYEVGRRTVLRSTHDYVEDGPKRDRLLWLGDLAATVSTFATTIGDLRPLRRSLLLAAATQMRNGALPGVGPHPSYLVVADYIPQWAIALGQYAWHSGDLETAALLLPTLRRTLAFLAERVGPEGLVGPEEETDWWVFFDWNRRETLGSPVEKKGYVTVLSLMTAEAFRQAARTARLVGHDACAAAWSARADELFERVMERCWDDWRGGLVDWVRGGEQSPHRSRFTAAWAVLTDVGTKAQRARLLDDLVDPTSRLGPTTTGYGQLYNVEALFHGGRPRAALDLVRRYWGAMLDRGATTFWESFDPDEDPGTALDMYGRRFATSLCHAWSGAVAGSLATHLLGVTPLAAGATRVAVAPVLGDVAWVEGTVATARGDVAVRWTASGGRIEVPEGTTARITWAGASCERGAGSHDVP